jgi:hypothetical protein
LGHKIISALWSRDNFAGRDDIPMNDSRKSKKKKKHNKLRKTKDDCNLRHLQKDQSKKGALCSIAPDEIWPLCGLMKDSSCAMIAVVFGLVLLSA